VKEIVELHGGDVEVASEYGKGTTVTLWLPVAEAEHAAAA
jgi:signal transduction histidine kinase